MVPGMPCMTRAADHLLRVACPRRCGCMDPSCSQAPCSAHLAPLQSLQQLQRPSLFSLKSVQLPQGRRVVFAAGVPTPPPPRPPLVFASVTGAQLAVPPLLTHLPAPPSCPHLQLMGAVGALGFTPLCLVLPVVLYLMARGNQLAAWQRWGLAALAAAFSGAGVLAAVGAVRSIVVAIQQHAFFS